MTVLPAAAPAATPSDRRRVEGFAERVGPHGIWVEGRVPDRLAGPPVLCLGGIFDGSWMFRRFMNALAARGHAVYAMNLRGQYLTHWPDVAALSAADYLDDIREVRRALDLGREAVLVGYSIGGPLVLAAAAEESPRAVLLYDPDPVQGVGRGERPGRHPPVMEFWPPKRIVEEMWGGPVSRRHYEETLELFKRSRFSGRAYREICEDLLAAPPERVGAPVLVVGVSGRNAVHAAYFERYESSWYVFEGYSHGMILFSPQADVVARFAASWLAGGAPVGRRRFFRRRLDGRLELRAEDGRLRLRYLTSWRAPTVVVRGAETRMREVGPGRDGVEGERTFEAEFLLPAGAGFEIRGDDGLDRAPGGALYRPRARAATLADGELFLGDLPAKRSPPRHEDLDVRDDALDFTYRVRVALPRDHDPARGPYPVAVFNDGQHVWTHQGFGRGWWADRTAGLLARAGRIPDIVLVGVHHHVKRAWAYLPPPLGRADLYVAFLRRLLADLGPRYGLTDDPRRTAIIGASYGACNAVYAALEAPDRFGLVGSLSYAYLRGSPTRRRMKAMRRLPFRRLYVDHGTAWSARERHRHDNDPVSRDLVRIAEERGMIHGLDLRYVVGRGHFHDEPSWRKRLPGCLEFLFG